ncbi:hypothetical protein ACWELY_03825, partial [Streptomyces sp. NPDC004599]
PARRLPSPPAPETAGSRARRLPRPPAPETAGSPDAGFRAARPLDAVAAIVALRRSAGGGTARAGSVPASPCADHPERMLRG